MNKLTKVFVLDTNVILHDSSCIYNFQENDIVIPIQVIEELDNFKKGLETINFNAREFTRFLDEKSSDHIFNGGLSLGEGLGTIKIMLTCVFDRFIKKNLKNQSVDAEIINTAYTMQKNPEYKNQQVIIVSKDVNLRMKARALGVMAQDYLNDAVVNTDEIVEGIKDLEVPKSTIDKVHSKKNEYSDIEMDIKGAYENQNFVLKNGKSNSALVTYKSGRVRIITKEKLTSFHIKPKNAEQVFTMGGLLDPGISIMTIGGKAGTGKTILTLACGLRQLKEDIYDKMAYSRKTIAMGNDEIGFLPGDIEDKLGPFMNGIKDNLDIIAQTNMENKNMIESYKKDSLLFMEALPYIRGRSLHKLFLIIDEAQNLTPHDVKTIVTRAGEGTKMIFIGDIHQIDNPYLDEKSNGLSYLVQKFKGQPCYSHIHLIKSERSALAELAGSLL